MPKKILLADDSITIQKVVELTFSDGDYEVIATNNGTKAIEVISRIKPDIILTDIIMPEKNGYEVCEWVKSHPEYRNIPVILLTGTFEPFDPDRAEKAGCDAVVTKPFESQSLIQKVEELISARGAAAESMPEQIEEPSLGDSTIPKGERPAFQSETAPLEEERVLPSPSEAPSFDFGEASDEPEQLDESESRSTEAAFESTPFPQEQEEPKPQGDVFGGAVSPDDSFEDDATRMIPRMSTEDLKRLRDQEQSAAPSAESPAERTPEAPPLTPSTPEAEERESSPFESTRSEQEMDEGATKMIPKMSMEDIQRLQQQQQEDASQPDTPMFGGEPGAEEPAPFETEEPAFEPPADEEPEAPAFASEEQRAPAFETEEPQPAYAAEEPEESTDDSSTRLIPKMAFDDIQRLQEQGSEEEADVPEAAEGAMFGAGAPARESEIDAPNPFAEEAGEETATAPEEETARVPEEESAPFTEPQAEQIPAPPLPPEHPGMAEEEPVSEPSTAQMPAEFLSEDQIERIARRVVEILSEKAVREIAWEVIPETAEMVVRERIRELEREDV